MSPKFWWRTSKNSYNSTSTIGKWQEEGAPTEHYLMAPKHKPSATTGTVKPRTRGTKAHHSEPPAKRTRMATTTTILTRTIHQQVTSQLHQTGMATVSMAQQLKKPAKNNKIPSSRSTTVGVSKSCLSRSSVHPTEAQHPGFHHLLQGWDDPLLSH